MSSKKNFRSLSKFRKFNVKRWKRKRNRVSLIQGYSKKERVASWRLRRSIPVYPVNIIKNP
jgi:hypothetical protein